MVRICKNSLGTRAQRLRPLDTPITNTPDARHADLTKIIYTNRPRGGPGGALPPLESSIIFI